MAPRQELRIARDIGHQIEQLHRREWPTTRRSAWRVVKGRSGPRRLASARARRAGGRNRRRRDSSTASAARPRPSGSPWRGPARPARRIPPASRSDRSAHAWASAAGTGRSVRKSTSAARRSSITCRISSRVSPRPTIRPDLVNIDGSISFTFAQQSQRGEIARARPDGRIEPRHGLEIVVEDVGPRGDHGLDGAGLAHEVGRQDLDGRRWAPTCAAP